MIIQTSFGSIRPWQIADAETIAMYANNEKIWLNLRDVFPHPYTLEDANTFIRTATAQKPMTIFALATPTEAIGSIGLSINKDVHRLTAELGYWLAEPFWGKGIMSEAVRSFTEAAFTHFNLVRIYAEPYATNQASCRVLEKAGFVFEGRLRCSAIKNNQIIDQLLYAKVNC